MDHVNHTPITLDFVRKFHLQMQEHNIMLCYRGKFSQSIAKSILAMTERKMEIDKTDMGVKRKVFNVMMECIQNIFKTDVNIRNDYALFMIGSIDTQYIIFSGNIIEKQRTEFLTNKLNEINSLDKEKLKQLYQSVITSNTSGALSEDELEELGLIDIAKKSGNKLDFNFIDVSDSSSFFSLKTIITRT